MTIPAEMLLLGGVWLGFMACFFLWLSSMARRRP